MLDHQPLLATSSTVRPSEPYRTRTAVSKPPQTLRGLTPDITDSLTCPSAKQQTVPRSRITFSVIRRRDRDQLTDWRPLTFWTACAESPRTSTTAALPPRRDPARGRRPGRPWSFDGDGALFRLVSEAQRIRLAHLFDPLLAIHTSVVDPLPHQITGVYDAMLPRQPLRFLLADDPGAGKTIMAGLLIRQ